MATDVWNINAGSAEGRDNFFRPIERADKIVEDQGLLPSKLAAAERKRVEDQTALDFYAANPDALKDKIGQGFDYNEAFYTEQTQALEDKTQQRGYSHKADELVQNANEITIPESIDADGRVIPAQTRAPTSEIERLEVARRSTNDYQVGKLIESRLKLAYGGDVNSAVAQGDYAAAYESAKKAGIFAGKATLKQNDSGGYTFTPTNGSPIQYTEAQVKELFFSQATKEKLALERTKHQQVMLGKQFDAASRMQIAQLNADTRYATSKYGGGRAQGGQPVQASAQVQSTVTVKPEAKQWYQSLSAEQKQALNGLQETPENKRLHDLAKGNTQDGLKARNALLDSVRKPKADPLAYQKQQEGSQAVPASIDPAYDAVVKEHDLAKTNVSQIEADLRLMSGTLSGKNFTDEKRQKAAAALVQAKAAQEAAKLKVDSMQSGISPVFNRREVAAGRLSREY
jgi:hypothetical protein